MPKIYVWINSRAPEWFEGAALAEDGNWLAGHISSSEDFFRLDMGLTSKRKHDVYSAHYPDGFELVEVPDSSKPHAGLDAAYALHRALTATETA